MNVGQNNKGNIKVVLLGHKNAQKYQLLQAISNIPIKVSNPNERLDFVITEIEYNQTTVKLQIWDHGDDMSRSFARVYFRGSRVICVCFDVQNFNVIEIIALKRLITSDFPRFVLIGCKTTHNIPSDQLQLLIDEFSAVFVATKAMTKVEIQVLEQKIAQVAIEQRVQAPSTRIGFNIFIDCSEETMKIITMTSYTLPNGNGAIYTHIQGVPVWVEIFKEFKRGTDVVVFTDQPKLKQFRPDTKVIVYIRSGGRTGFIAENQIFTVNQEVPSLHLMMQEAWPWLSPMQQQ